MGSKESLARVRKSLPIRAYEKSRKLGLKEVPAGNDASSSEGIHRMMTHMRFYKELVDPAEWLLIFRADTILCAQSNQSLNDWLEYDGVGAPWSVTPFFQSFLVALRAPLKTLSHRSLDDRFGGNGALSLRRVSAVKQVLSFQTRLYNSDPSDRWLSQRMGLLPNAKMAPGSKEANFSVENNMARRADGLPTRPNFSRQRVGR